MTRILNSIAFLLFWIPSAVTAASVNYTLQADRSEVGFIYTLSGAQNRGTMPVVNADIAIDFQQFSASTVDVSVDVRNARAGMIFATEALKAASVLDADNHPTIRFQSTAIRAKNPRNLSEGGAIDGLLTIRGVTRPVTLNAAVFRQQGTAQGDLSQLSFRINGQVSRSAFGATGYGDIVSDTITLDIAARVVQAQ
ncbi:polyisoprenoid-binding protein YceI [Yoonia maricola]|uniref:Polyisoprenoid-binding protein YceI n=1 Tax=Yoonia maricola TaxID=420999 RepID=A0A2M8WNR8_9RHOB|nr:YceI family protein [Yoonia maricola]PJI92526.1 polyisoprenoid-binding protein YceI [Yoonia maricola]